ncbi:MAG: EamA family transporter [Clostridia bacterium]|nr:EamA family transporter [Clostridia bacterium]
MLQMALPLLLVVVSNTFYHIIAKFTPEKASPFLSLTVTYVVAAILSFCAFLLADERKSLIAEASNLNWTSLALGVSIIGLELGYIYFYRAGWKVSIGSLVANIALACVLLLVGLLLFKESITLRQVIGIIVCALGLVLVTK